VIQFVSCFYNPVDQIPTRSDLEAGRRLVEMIQMVEGDVFVGTYSSLPALAGKKTYAHTMSIRDVLRSKTSKEQRKLAADIRRALVTEPLFDAVILGPLGWRPILGRDTAKLEAVLKERYEYKGRVVKNESLFWPRVGIKTRPSKLYVLRRPRGKRQDGNAL